MEREIYYNFQGGSKKKSREMSILATTKLLLDWVVVGGSNLNFWEALIRLGETQVP